MKRLQYATTLMSFSNLEYFWVMSSEDYISATCTFPISKLLLGMLNSVVGQLADSCDSHCGPFHHSVDVDKTEGSHPLDMRSAGLDLVGTCLHVADVSP
jgi:hypothetical protein